MTFAYPYERADERRAPPPPHPQVLFTEIDDGSGVLLHLDTKFYYTLNATGVVVWKALARSRRGVGRRRSPSGSPPSSASARQRRGATSTRSSASSAPTAWSSTRRRDPMPSLLLHTTPIVWSIEGLASDPLAGVLSMLDAGHAGGVGPSVRFALRPASSRGTADPRLEGWEPSFFHGDVQAYRRGGAFLLSDRASRVTLPPVVVGVVEGGSATIEAEIAPPEREPWPGSTAALLQIALMTAVRRVGIFHLHAAALASPEGHVVLVVGDSGAGKTTTTLALLEAGADYLGDDTLFLAAEAGGVRVIAFPRAFHLGAATLAAFPRLEPLAGPPSSPGEKRPLDPRAAFPGRARPSVALTPGRVLALFPAVGDGPVTELGPVPRADAFGHLLASSAALVVEGLPGREENFAILGALLATARCVENPPRRRRARRPAPRDRGQDPRDPGLPRPGLNFSRPESNVEASPKAFHERGMSQ